MIWLFTTLLVVLGSVGVCWGLGNTDHKLGFPVYAICFLLVMSSPIIYGALSLKNVLDDSPPSSDVVHLSDKIVNGSSVEVFYDPNAVFQDEHYLVVIGETEKELLVLTSENKNIVKASNSQPVYIRQTYTNGFGGMSNLESTIWVGELPERWVNRNRAKIQPNEVTKQRKKDPRWND